MRKENGENQEGGTGRGVVVIGANWRSVIELFRKVDIKKEKILFQTAISWYALSGRSVLVEEDHLHDISVIRNFYPPGWCSVFSEIYGRIFAKNISNFLRMHKKNPSVLCFVQPQPYFEFVVSEVEHTSIVYYCVDDYRQFWPDRKSSIEMLENDIVRKSALVVCASKYMMDELQKRIKGIEKKIIHIPNGTFSEYIVPEVLKTPAPLPEDIKHLARPVIGYLGNIQGRVDWNIMELLVVSLPRASILLIGPPPDKKHSDSRALSELLTHSNCFFIGYRKQEEIMKYICSFDVCIIPEPLYPLNVAGCPQKLWNYLASSRPIVSTAVPEQMLLQPAVKIANGAESFVQHVKELIDCNGEDGFGEERLNLAKMHTWDELGKKLTFEIKAQGII